jgi:uncharacterized protein YodC (DUF2158 family)
MSTFTVGEIVQLKSGGPRMTIKSIDGSDVACIWFSGHKLNGRSFPLMTLMASSAESLSTMTLEELIVGAGEHKLP